tara:strand:- start:63 stop:569 length:507 start_codon:yes stop_codon:yes gene_type:complete
MIGVNEIFPTFHMNGVEGEELVIRNSSDYSGWRVFYFYPKDFTLICPTEICGMDKLLGEATVVGFSGDNEFCKKAWKESLPDTLGGIRHTLLADCGLKLSHELGIVDFANLVSLRATYIVDPEDKIQHVSVNALDTGRSADEVLRTVQGLKAGGLTGCSWNPGDPYVV